MPSWDVFKKRNPWIMEVLSRMPTKSFAATKDAAHLLAAIDQQVEITSRMNYFAARLKEEIDELQFEIDKFHEEVATIQKYRSELTAIEQQLDRALLELRTLRKAHTVRRLINNDVVDTLTQQGIEVAAVYAQTKTQPEIVRRMDMVSNELNDTIALIRSASEALPKKEEPQTEQKTEGGE